MLQREVSLCVVSLDMWCMLACSCCCSITILHVDVAAATVSNLASTVVLDLVSLVPMSFSVNFAMGFTERLSIYCLHGSADCPDAESLVIPLMQLQIIGVPMRSHAGQDWFFLSWQNLNGITLNLFMRVLRFESMSHEFIIAALL